MVVVAFLTGPFAFISSIIYMRRGIYTKSFKGTLKGIYSQSFQLVVLVVNASSVAMHSLCDAVCDGQFAGNAGHLNDIPVVNHWFAEIREIILVKTRQ
jgi:hypothetical protein